MPDTGVGTSGSDHQAATFHRVLTSEECAALVEQAKADAALGVYSCPHGCKPPTGPDPVPLYGPNIVRCSSCGARWDVMYRREALQAAARERAPGLQVAGQDPARLRYRGGARPDVPGLGGDAVSEQRWTITVCPHGRRLNFVDADAGWVHVTGAAACERVSEAEQIEVAPASEVDRLTRELRQYVDTLARRDSEIATMFSRDEYRALGEKVNRLTRELEGAKYALAAERRQVTELCVLAGHPLGDGACRCGERRA